MSPLPNSGVVHSNLLDQVDKVLATTRPDSAQIMRPGRVNGPSGSTTTDTPVGDPVDVRVSPISTLRGQERLTADQVQGTKLAVLAGPRGWDVRSADRIVVNGTRTFEVLEVLGPHSYEPELRVVVDEVGL